MKEQEIEKRKGKLESLTEAQQAFILEMALNARLIDVANALKEHGIEASLSTLSRFIREHRQRQALEEGKEMKEAVETLAERGRNGKLREGSLEVARQRVYDRVLSSQDPEEAREIYAAMVKEETKLKEIALEARKVAVLEQQVKLQQAKMEAELAQARERQRLTATVTQSRPETVVDVASSPATSPAPAQLELKGAGLEEEQKKSGALTRLLMEVQEIVNRGGPPEEKVVELRAFLAERMKLASVA